MKQKIDKIVGGLMKQYGASREDALECVHEAYIRIHDKELKDEQSRLHYWYVTARNEYLRMKKTDGKYVELLVEPDSSYHMTENINQEIHNHLNLMNQLYAKALVLREWYGMQYKEIAETLDISIGAVKQRLRRGRQYMKQHLGHLL